MKYLKLFENHNHLYSEISTHEFEEKCGWGGQIGDDEWDDEYVHNNWEDFTVDELNYLISLKLDVDLKSDLIGLLDDSPQAYISLKQENSIIFYVCKVKDEWYYVYNPMKILKDDSPFSFYKCDQFDGLISCIKNEILK
jgi:hypothetical protein